MSKKFNVGDKIIIKSVEEIENIIKKRRKMNLVYMYRYISSMKKYSNFWYIITNIDKDGYLKFNGINDNINNYKWHRTWVKRINLFEDKDFMI